MIIYCQLQNNWHAKYHADQYITINLNIKNIEYIEGASRKCGLRRAN